MVDAICNGNVDAGYRALVEHTDLLQQRARQEPIPQPKFAPRQFE
jgi:hypothetical protein